MGKSQDFANKMREKKIVNRSSKKDNKNLFFHFLKNKGQIASSPFHSLTSFVHSIPMRLLTFFLKNEIKQTYYFLNSAQ